MVSLNKNMSFYFRHKLKISLSLVFITYSFFAINVRKNITNDDIRAIKMLKVDNFCKNINNF